jgi:hypothetical protein
MEWKTRMRQIMIMKMKNGHWIKRCSLIALVAVVSCGLLSTQEAFGKPKKAKAKTKAKAKPQKTKRPAATQTTYGGRAVLVSITNVAPANILIGDTGALPSRGGTLSVMAGPTNIASGLFMELGQASVIGTGGVAQSTVVITNLGINVVGTNGTNHTLMFDLLQVSARAQGTMTGAVISASTAIQGLEIDGAAVAVTGEANQTVLLDGVTITLNAQSGSASNQVGQATVAGIAISVDGGLGGTIGLARAQIQRRQQGSDRITGGGFIGMTNVTNGARANFNVSGGMHNGSLRGHLNFADATAGVLVTGTNVTAYSMVDATTRQIVYDVSINGVAGTATVVVSDKGEPGRNDTFAIQLSTGYSLSGNLGRSGRGGGNIQLHVSRSR